MSLFRWNWLRKIVRNHTSPIPENKATLWKRRLSIMYFVFCWNAFGFVCYAMYSGKKDWADYHGLSTEMDKAIPKAKQWAEVLNISGNVHVIQVKGVQKRGEYDFESIAKPVGIQRLRQDQEQLLKENEELNATELEVDETFSEDE